jgi:hypothetical protein
LERGTASQIKGKKTIRVYLPDAGQMAYEHKQKLCCSKNKMLECSDLIDLVIQMVRVYNHSLDAITSTKRF